MNIKIKKDNKIIYILKNIKRNLTFKEGFSVKILGYTKSANNIKNLMNYFKIENKASIISWMIYDFNFKNNIITLYVNQSTGFCKTHSQEIIPNNHKNLLKKLLEIK